MKLKDIEGLLPEENKRFSCASSVCSRAMEEGWSAYHHKIGEKALELDVEKIVNEVLNRPNFDVMLGHNKRVMYDLAQAIARAFPVKVVEK